MQTLNTSWCSFPCKLWYSSNSCKTWCSSFHCFSFVQSCGHFSNIQLKMVINRCKWSTFTRQQNAMNENIRMLLQGWVARVTLIIIIKRYGPLVIGDYIFFCHHLFASSCKQWMQAHLLCVLVILKTLIESCWVQTAAAMFAACYFLTSGFWSSGAISGHESKTCRTQPSNICSLHTLCKWSQGPAIWPTIVSGCHCIQVVLIFARLYSSRCLLHLGPNVITLRTFITLRTSYYTCAFNEEAVFKTLQTARKCAFSCIPTKAHEISENYVIEGGEKEKIYRDDPV